MTDFHYVEDGGEVYEDARRRAEDGAVVCLLPAIHDGELCVMTGFAYPDKPAPMPPMATDSSPRRRAAFLIAYAIATHGKHPKVNFRC